jgi:hypothetical protein
MKHSIAIACVLLSTSVQSSYVRSSYVRSSYARSSYVVSAFRRTVTQTSKPEMTRVPQFDNDRAVSWKSVIPAHTESTLHRHDRFRTVIGIVGGDLTLVDANGRKTLMHYETGKSYWQEPMPAGAMHKDVNETSKTIELIVVENK